MEPTIEPGDVVLIDQYLKRRRRPSDGGVYAVNEQPLTGKPGGALHRVTLSGRTLILNSDNPDKTKHPTRAFEIKGANLPDVLVGEVVWCGRAMTPPKAD